MRHGIQLACQLIFDVADIAGELINSVGQRIELFLDRLCPMHLIEPRLDVPCFPRFPRASQLDFLENINLAKCLIFLVGALRFELGTPSSPDRGSSPTRAL
jgi:hypothetical protein